MHRFIDGEDRMQQALLPHSLEDYVDGENPVRVIEVFIEELDLAALGFAGMTPAATGRPAHHPSTLLKIYLYGYLNRVSKYRTLLIGTGHSRSARGEACGTKTGRPKEKARP